MSEDVRLGPVEITGAEFVFIVRTLEAAFRSERARRSAYKACGDRKGEYMAAGMMEEVERVLRKLGWKGPRHRGGES